MVFVMLPVVSVAAFIAAYSNKIYPNVSVAGMNLSHRTVEEAWRQVDVLERDFLTHEKLKVIVEEDRLATAAGEPELELLFDEIGLAYDSKETVEKAYEHGRGGVWTQRARALIGLWEQPAVYEHIYSIDEQVLAQKIDEFANAIDKPGTQPHVEYDPEQPEGQQIQVYSGENGLIIDRELLKSEVLGRLGWLSSERVEVEVVEEKHQVSDAQMDETIERARGLLERELELKLPDGNGGESWVLADADIVGLVDFTGGFDEQKIEAYVEALAEGVNREPVNATFAFEDGKVVEFAASKEGLEIKKQRAVELINQALMGLSGADTGVVELPVLVTKAEVKTPDVNDLGIETLLGRGESAFHGSIAGRIHNVALTASRLNGVLVPPGETFSFNQTIGDVSRATGYQTAYVIKDGRTVLGDGGGVCQDSTTLFRAILDAGLPISERRGHSYRVGYYEQNSKPGFDATVFAPSVDLKFTNDTPAHILIQAKANTDNLSLVIELYGTDDGRVAEVSNYQQWGAVPAPPPLYQDDPTLAPGVVKQVDWAAPGLKVKFDYLVTRGGETLIEESFYTNYRPWQAVYLRGV